MDILSIISLLGVCLFISFVPYWLARYDLYRNIKSYNKRHKGKQQYNEKTKLSKYNQRLRDYFIVIASDPKDIKVVYDDE